jgi:hypothetical protein
MQSACTPSTVIKSPSRTGVLVAVGALSGSLGEACGSSSPDVPRWPWRLPTLSY